MVKSFSGKTWNFFEINEECLEAIKKESQVSDLVARILINRGLRTPGEVVAFLNAELKIPNPSSFIDMDKAVERVIKSIQSNESVTIIGDYDVDGITSTYLIVKYLNIVGLKPKYYIPNRFSDGYGISKSSVETAMQNETTLVIAVDSGTNSIEEIKVANECGIDFIILDHHAQLIETLPEAVAVVNPSRIDQQEIGFYHIKSLCAAGVVFLFLVALQRKLKAIDFFKNCEEPNLRKFTDIVTLGTLCDVMELRGINRAITKYTMAKNDFSLGITSLMKAFNIDKISSPEDLTFFIGPAINAAGRIGDPNVGLNLLFEESPERSHQIANQLVVLNKQRKCEEKKLLAEAMCMINEKGLSSNSHGICVYGEEWNEGIIGIVAGKLKDKFQKPVFVISISKDGIGKGSARSVEGIHLGQFLEEANKAGLLISGGGHALAGGFSIYKNKIEDFQKFIDDKIEGPFINSINIDDSLTAMSKLNNIARELSSIEPFGKGVEKPKFCFKRLRLKNLRKTNSGSHVMLNFSSEFDEGSIKAFIFNSATKNDIIEKIKQNAENLLDIVGTIDYHERFGSSIILDDIRQSE